jgi:hypothetical protein
MRQPYFLVLAAMLGASPAWGQLSSGAATPLPKTIATPAAPLEKLTMFDYRSVVLEWVDNHWQLRAGNVWLKDFGKREKEAREAVRLIRDLHLTQHGTIGTPRPVMEYWLTDGRAPQATQTSLRTVPFEPQRLRVERVQDQWCLRDDQHSFFTFGAHEDEARQALAVIQQYGFNQVGYIGQGVPVMIYFLTGPSSSNHSLTERLPSLGEETAKTSQRTHVDRMNTGVQPTRFLAPDQSGQNPALPSTTLPGGRQLAVPNLVAADPTGTVERVSLDWRQVQVRRENHDWKLVQDNYTLANFGANEYQARQALRVVQYYRFTEHCLVGTPPVFRYFLVQGQAPRGLLLGTNTMPFRPEMLQVQQLAKDFVIADGNRILFHFGEKDKEARQVLQILQQHKFDHLCRIGLYEPAGMVILVRTR